MTRGHGAVAGALALAISSVGSAPAADDISGRRGKDTVRAITAFGPRPAGSAAEGRVADLLARRFRAYGYRVRLQSFPLPRGGRSRNIVALPDGPTRALLVAHLDSVSAGPGANDNGSGLAALVEIARVLRGSDGVTLAALGAEERVETGSSLHLGSARLLRGLAASDRRRVRVALSLDMVAVGPSLYVRGLEARPNRSARAALSHARALRVAASYLQDGGLSDHAELTRGGLPAAWLQWRPDGCWHSACDVADRLHGRKLAAAARVALATARGAADGG